MTGEDYLRLIGSLIAGYLLGSIPVAYLVARTAGVNILEVGTGNPGAANVFRSISKVHGAVVFVGDVCKGGAAVIAASALGVEQDLLAAAGAAAVAGHMYPVFLRFRGGAALASAIGALVALLPVSGSVGLGAGLVAVALLHSSGHAAVVGLAAVLVTFLLLGEQRGERWQVLAGAFGIAFIVFARFAIKEAFLTSWKEFRKAVLRVRGGPVGAKDDEAG